MSRLPGVSMTDYCALRPLFIPETYYGIRDDWHAVCARPVSR